MKLVIRLSLLAVIIATGLYVYRHFAAGAPLGVVVHTVQTGRVESTVANTRAGTVKACRRSKVSPATGGQVDRLYVTEGDRVVVGQVLMALWNRDLQAHLALARGETEAAAARVQEACLNADRLDREARRLERLAERNLVAEEAVDRAVTQSRTGEAVCRGAGAAHEVAQAQTEAAAAALERTLLKAPFDGVVAEVNAEVGEYVTPSPPGIPTPPAVDLIDVSCILVSAPIDEVDAPAVEVGMEACVSLDAFPARRCSASVLRIAPYVLDREKQARTLEIEVEFRDPAESQGLLPGYTADVEIIIEAHDAVLRIPTEAVLEGPSVLVYRESDATLESRQFEAGLSNWRHTEVLSGLAAGERIVVSVDRAGVAAGVAVVLEPENQAAP